MKKIMLLSAMIGLFSSCVHDTYSMDNWRGVGCEQKKFKATIPVKRKCY